MTKDVINDLSRYLFGASIHPNAACRSVPILHVFPMEKGACEVIGQQDLQRHGLGQDTIITHLTIFFGLSWRIMD